MSTPRNKRQFAGAAADPAQRQITSFFAAQSPNSSAPADADVAQQPALPAHVQANLLSVGMRVRKSVPEGYKTAGSSAFKLWTDNTKPGAAKAPVVAAKPVSRELLPFCGINKVGGLDTQPEFVYAADEVPALDEVPELSMSQESTDSVESGPSRKRFFEEQDDLQGPYFRQFDPHVPGWDGEDSGNNRAIAVPHSRIKKGSALKGFDQENMAVDDDFDDANFLVFDGEKAMDVSF
ncbi:ribonucleotide reductase inhibitor [Trichoderma arundinaceum]|uniref:Ribonucleotide reductase inhibitor n=1 Tax=Trichoderma arundinaceum TaxID=490622 RepID=A0A395NUT7_TRIAR|nr:ribonucleotide reductase inhibitor [Trichoderma arundinaceum]